MEPPHDKTYHLTEDMVDKALAWLDDRAAYDPAAPFFMYWVPGAVHGPHHVAAEWADTYKGTFDDGWDAYRERTHRRQLEMVIIPAGSTPFRSTKLVAAHFGGTRNPLVISWPRRTKPDAAMRTQFHHVVDVVPTIYDVVGVTPPEIVYGHDQMRFDGESFVQTFADADAPDRKQPQFFDNNGSRGIWKDGWFACAFGPLYPWNTPASLPRIAQWDSATDTWELYHLNEDFSQAENVAAKHPEKPAALKADFLRLAEENKAFPIGAGNWLRLHPEDRVKTAYDSWTFTRRTRRMPEFTAPGLGRQSNVVEIEIETGDQSSGVLYAVSGGVAGAIAAAHGLRANATF